MSCKQIILAFSIALALPAMAKPSILSLKNTITDDAIVYPESFETDTHRMMQNWYLQNYTDLDREADSRPVVEVTDDVLISRLSKMPTTIEMPFNQIVKSYIVMYTEKKRSLVENMLGMSLYYMPIFEQALEREGLPLELKYLPVIESALNPDAVSRAGATGLWQFMLATGRGMGLEVSSLVDERRDPHRSSDAAARYLKQLYNIYNDWSLAIAAYNCGPGNVNKALRRVDPNQPKDFWAIYPLLPAETRGYVPCFIAANYAMTYYKEHNISPALARKPIITDSIHVTNRVHFEQISNILNMPVEELRVLNPQYRQDLIPGDIRPYSLVLPSRQVYSYIMSEDSILAFDAERFQRRTTVEPASLASLREQNDGEYITKQDVKYHKVRRGETLNSIAKRYGVSTRSIQKTNNGVRKPRRGQTLKIVTTYKVPIPRKPQEQVAAPDSVVTPDAVGQPVELADATEALEGESQQEAQAAPEASKVSTTPNARATAKMAKPSASKQSKERKRNQQKSVTVRKGENLTKIAKANGTTVAELQRLNKISGSKIQPGQKIRVK